MTFTINIPTLAFAFMGGLVGVFLFGWALLWVCSLINSALGGGSKG
jgi:hypothetical protein